jgi:hypothetical protein
LVGDIDTLIIIIYDVDIDEQPRTKAMTLLRDYLANLNSAESNWGIWVDPDNLDDYRIGQKIFENGGLLDEKVYIGNLEELSCGNQSQLEAIENFLSNRERYLHGIAEFKYGERLVRCNTKAVLTAWSEDRLDSDFREFLESEAAEIEAEWAKNEAELKIEELQHELSTL